ncbi:MAG: uracil-DNA glycosylase [Bacilli bacterium]|nr:uracil-DNA glycosylase [Bacilli bacterium]MBQ6404659.1 uracil-DNA glycosylase [Bacilli bacterium]
MTNMIGNDWDILLQDEYQKEYFKKLLDFVKKEYQTKTIYPKQNEVFNAFRYTSFDNVKVVILGQDPYHGPNQAEGLSFSVSNEVLKPPSLQNIFKELESDLGISFPKSNSLKPWAKQGVLLLNAVLTVEEHKPTSHKDKGWETFTDDIIKILNNKQEPIVFILWGAYARNKKSLITNSRHLIIESAHPSPFSARNGFFGSKPFSRTNKFLRENNLKEIDWRVE